MEEKFEKPGALERLYGPSIKEELKTEKKPKEKVERSGLFGSLKGIFTSKEPKSLEAKEVKKEKKVESVPEKKELKTELIPWYKKLRREIRRKK